MRSIFFLLLLSLVIPSLALTPAQREHHLQQMAAAIGTTINREKSTAEEILGTYDGTAALFMQSWDLYCDWDEKVDIKVKHENAWAKDEDNFYRALFIAEDGDKYIIAFKEFNANSIIFGASWLNKTPSITQQTTLTQQASERSQIIIDPRIAQAPEIEVEQYDLKNETFIGSVVSSAFSKDGLLYAIGVLPSNIVVYDSSTGKQLIKWDISVNDEKAILLRKIQFSADDRMILSCGIGAVGCWDAVTGKLLSKINGDKDDLFCSIYSDSRGKFITISGNGDCSGVYDIVTGDLIQKISGNYFYIIWSNDEKLQALVTTGKKPNRIIIRDVVSEKELIVFDLPQDYYTNDIKFSPNGKYLTAALTDGSVLTWNIFEKKLLFKLQAFRKEAKSIQYIPDSSAILISGDQGTMIVTDSTTGIPIARITDPKERNTIESAIFNVDGMLLGTSQSILRLKEKGQSFFSCISSIQADIEKKQKYLEIIDVLYKDNKLSVAQALLAKSLIRDGKVTDSQVLDDFLTGKISDKEFSNQFK